MPTEPGVNLGKQPRDPGPPIAPPPPPGPYAGAAYGAPAGDPPYPEWFLPAAVVGVLFFPLITLIASAVARANESGPRRQRQLRNVIIASACWMVLWVVAILGLFFAFSVHTTSVITHVQQVPIDPGGFGPP